MNPTQIARRFPVLAATTGLLALSAAANAQPVYGVMFRTGGQTSGLNPILYDINPQSGAATNPRNVNVNDCVGIAVDPTSGVMFGLTDQFGRINNVSGQGGKNLIFTINPTTGAAVAVGRVDPTGVFQVFEGDIAFNPVDGSFWGVSTLINSARLFTINKATGAATLGPSLSPLVGTDLDISALAFDHSGNLYVLDTRYPNNPGPAILERIDPASGAILASWTSSTSLGNVAGMTFLYDGMLLIADGDTSGTNQLYRFDFASSAMVPVGPTNAAGGIYQGLAGLVAGCTPVITTQPLPATICNNQSAPFSTAAAGDGVFYQWQLEVAPNDWRTLGNDPMPLTCGTGAFAFASPINSASVTLGVRNCPGPFRVRCLITNACGSITTNPVALTIGGAACCPADFNHDGDLNPDDLGDFITCYFGTPPCDGADFNHDADINPDDLGDFITTYFAGC